jgi:hypothetical protein
MTPRSRPILYNAAMVRAILEDRKTKTRRIINPQFTTVWGGGNSVRNDDKDYVSIHVNITMPDGNWKWIRCPYGKPGDQLWARETFVLERWDSEIGAPPFVSDRPTQYHPGDGSEFDSEYWLRPHYRATDPAPDLSYGEEDDPKCKWTPSIFMPRWASRIELEIIKIHVERLQDISKEDALAEGVRESHFHQPADWMDVDHYHELWNSINAKRGFGWDTNPYVWVVEFKRI